MKATIEKHSTLEENISLRTITYVVFFDGKERRRFAECTDAEAYAATLEESTLTAADARQIFTAAIEQETDPDRRSKLELLRAYFTDSDFRKGLEQLVWDINNK